MLSLGHIVISDLVVINLFMHSLSGMILLYLAVPFFTLKVFLHEIQYHSKVTSHSLVLLLRVTGYTQLRNESTIHSNSTRHSKIVESWLSCEALLYAIRVL